MLTPKLVSSQTIYQSKYTNLNRDIIEINGGEYPREVITRPPAVVIVPEVRPDVFLMVRQWRHAAQEFLLEFPAGKVEEGMTLEETAYKELEEEVGYAAGVVLQIGTFYASPGYSTEQLTAYYAKNLMPKKVDGDPDEDIEVVEKSMEEIGKAIEFGEIRDGKTISAYTLYQFRRRVLTK